MEITKAQQVKSNKIKKAKVTVSHGESKKIKSMHKARLLYFGEFA